MSRGRHPKPLRMAPVLALVAAGGLSAAARAAPPDDAPATVAVAPATAVAAVAATTPDEARSAALRVCADPSNLPFSNERGEGYENRIAQVLADELQRPVAYTWNLQRRSFLRRTLHAGRCDVVIGTPVGLEGVLQTRPYYASTYVFVTARSAAAGASEGTRHPAGFDDPVLARWRIGLQALGAEGSNTPPASALARRGLAARVVGYPMWAEEAVESPIARIVDDVAAGRLETAVVWGPIGGYFAQRHREAVEVQPVTGDPAQPGLAFRYAMAVGVRRGEHALRDALQGALDRRREEIDRILDAYDVPRVPVAEALP